MEKIENNIENTPEINWVRPNIEKERGELERVVRDFLSEELTPDKLEEILERSPVVELSDEDWAKLENTDSFHNIEPGQVDQARKICEEYNQSLREENKRDFNNLLDGFNNESKMESPIIIKNSEGRLHLLSGNTRLMISRVLGIRPKVIIGEVK